MQGVSKAGLAKMPCDKKAGDDWKLEKLRSWNVDVSLFMDSLSFPSQSKAAASARLPSFNRR